MTQFEMISILLQGVTLICFIVGIWHGYKNLLLLIKAHKDNHDWNRRIETQKALAKLRDLNIDDLHIHFPTLNKTPCLPLVEIYKRFKELPELDNQCTRLLNFYEGMAVGVHLGIYDELTVKASRRGAMESTFRVFKEYIIHSRDRVNRPPYMEAEKLISKWSEETMKESTRSLTGSIDI